MTNLKRQKILVVDSQRTTRRWMQDILSKSNYDVITAEDFSEGAQLCQRNTFSLIICEKDSFFAQHDQIEPLGIPTIVTTSSVDDVECAVRAIKAGASDFIVKTMEIPKHLATVERIIATAGPKQERSCCNKPTTAPTQTVKIELEDPLIGVSQKMIHLKTLIGKIAPSDARVLIYGANGTGKELVARSLHNKSGRSHGPFVEVNCAAIPSELIESELFGHEKGSFTSAIKQHKGKFEQADGGTIFLDEIGDMSLSAQAKVLRALQERKVTRVGSDKDIDVNVRVLAATNKNLLREIELGTFREDLYHRLSVIVLIVPLLNDRADDIPLLTNHFIRLLSPEFGKESMTIDNDALEYLASRSWRGNVRELRNVVERLIILSGNSITLEDVKSYTETV